MRYRVLIEQDEDGVFVAECPSLPGCVSQGKTRKVAIENIRDAIHGYLESLEKHNEPIPPPIDEEKDGHIRGRSKYFMKHPG
jgi:predicted RNase H-like HicB family nuclease